MRVYTSSKSKHIKQIDWWIENIYACVQCIVEHIIAVYRLFDEIKII